MTIPVGTVHTYREGGELHNALALCCVAYQSVDALMLVTNGRRRNSMMV